MKTDTMKTLLILTELFDHRAPSRRRYFLLAPPCASILLAGPLCLLAYFAIVAEGEAGDTAALFNGEAVAVLHGAIHHKENTLQFVRD